MTTQKHNSDLPADACGGDGTYLYDETPQENEPLRPEGIYASSSVYIGAAQLILIERVNGDNSVNSVEITRGEAKSLIEQIERLLDSSPRGRYDVSGNALRRRVEA